MSRTTIMKGNNDTFSEPLDSLTIAEIAIALAPETPPPGLRAMVLERVRTGSVVRRAAEGVWQRVAPGIEVKTLFYDVTARAVSFLLRAQPNASLPAHRHTGNEECVVLEGECTLGDVTLRAGDYLFAESGTEHPAATTRAGALIYLRVAAADYPYARL